MIRDIRGISACKVYPQMMLPSNVVSSYLTFSPFQPTPLSPPGKKYRGRSRLFSVALSVPERVGTPAIHRVHCSALSGLSFPDKFVGNDSTACSKNLCKERTAKVITDYGIERMMLLNIFLTFLLNHEQARPADAGRTGN